MRITANEQGTTAFSSLTRWTHFFVASLLVAILLAPTILCAIPNASMTPDEHACCEQMMGECGRDSMSSCCTIVPNTSVGKVTPTEKSAPISEQIEQAAIRFAEPPQPAPSPGAQFATDLQSSPPGLDARHSIQILRI
jgi:hypothetical protein